MRKSVKGAVVTLGAMTAIAGSTFVAGPAMAASTPIGACGGGKMHVVDHIDVKKNGKKVATTYLLWDGTKKGGTNCVVTWKAKPNTKFVGAAIAKKGATHWTYDKGRGRKYSTYAGPVKVTHAKGKCILFGGAYDTIGYQRADWGHCGK